MSPTSVSTKQVTINAAFLKEIKEDNQHLKQLWDKAVPLAEHVETATNHWPELIEHFAEMRDQLALHFSLEEAYGYFDDAIDIAPQLSTVADCLRNEHTNLFAEVRDLADAAIDAKVGLDDEIAKVLSAFQNFRQRFERHEESELKLILQAMDDIGGGD
ncbi:MAG: hemerythrin domain-containing protein [Pirellulaceae bacterium]